jgi:hypothetical protein
MDKSCMMKNDSSLIYKSGEGRGEYSNYGLISDLRQVHGSFVSAITVCSSHPVSSLETLETFSEEE